MSRISIDVTPEQHKKLKAMAALQGKSIKEFVLASTLGGQAADVMAELEGILRQRLKDAEAARSTRTVGDVFNQAREEAGEDVDV